MLTLGPITWILLSPALGGSLLFFIPKEKTEWLKRISLLSVCSSLFFAAAAFIKYDRMTAGYQFVDKIDWIPSLGIAYHVGVDGINLVLLLMTAILAFAGVIVSCSIKDRLKEYLIFYLFLIVGCFGVLSSLNIFFMYFFYETAVVPVFPLIGVWGSGNKEYATMKLTLYLTLGAVLALLALLALYFVTGLNTFDLTIIEKSVLLNPLPIAFQRWAFPLIMVGFGVILTLWPFHTWSPMGYAAAPTSVSMLHAGVLKKLGAYAIIRLGIGLMPDGARIWMPLVAWIAVINIIYCGLVAFTQKDLKFILGYSSCSHMGYILLGLSCMTPIALNGTVFFMFAHGIMAALGFALVGFIYEQTHTRLIDDWGGFGKKIPFIASIFVMMSLASAGLPGFANFVGETMILLGAWDKYRLQAMFAVAGLVITAGYMLKMVRGSMQGPLNAHGHSLNDAKGLQKLPYLILIVILLVVGFFPSLLLNTISSGTKPTLDRIQSAQDRANGEIVNHAF
ncbi:MAG: NADH-quinone oxidoreductase subunit M [Candidatus Omnitrophica bacterium CG07_land_8_20_14_0_80_50_8]|nr:MAG: NADH-quinone oxidoreductase subunit M [Candidatus Omnitrophica bacterium CG07_land_8_20_14_0_80_50_8]